MSISNDTFCQLCERLITKEDWNKQLYSSRHLYKEAHGYWPAYFPERKLIGKESFILEKAFWKMIFATKDIEGMDLFLVTYFMMTTDLKF